MQHLWCTDVGIFTMRQNNCANLMYLKEKEQKLEDCKTRPWFCQKACEGAFLAVSDCSGIKNWWHDGDWGTVKYTLVIKISSLSAKNTRFSRQYGWEKLQGMERSHIAPCFNVRVWDSFACEGKCHPITF